MEANWQTHDFVFRIYLVFQRMWLFSFIIEETYLKFICCFFSGTCNTVTDGFPWVGLGWGGGGVWGVGQVFLVNQKYEPNLAKHS